MNSFAATSSSAGSRMALAGRTEGASGFRSIAWWYGREGGNRSEAFSLNTFAYRWYSGGSVTSGLSLIACSASLEAIVCRLLASAIVILVGISRRSRSIIGKWTYSSHPLAQSICGCIAANHGYPRMSRWFPKSVRKNLMRRFFCPVCTSRSVYRVMSPLRFLVPSMLNSGLACFNLVIGNRSWYARSSLMKFSVAPESSRVSISALLDAVCTYALMMIDLISDRYTRSSVPLLIQAAQIRAFKNPILWSPLLELRSFEVISPFPRGTGLGLGPVGRRLDLCSWLIPELGPRRSNMGARGSLVVRRLLRS